MGREKEACQQTRSKNSELSLSSHTQKQIVTQRVDLRCLVVLFLCLSFQIVIDCDGASTFDITIVSTAFASMSVSDRHKQIRERVLASVAHCIQGLTLKTWLGSGIG